MVGKFRTIFILYSLPINKRNCSIFPVNIIVKIAYPVYHEIIGNSLTRFVTFDRHTEMSLRL